MYLTLAIVVMIQTIGIACGGTSCDRFVTEGLFPDFINVSENSRCGSLRRIKPLLKLFKMTFIVEPYIKDCTSPIILQSNSTQPFFDARSKPIRSHKEEQMIIECFAQRGDKCTNLFFHLRKNYQDFTNETYFPDIFSANILDSSLLSLVRCNGSNLSNTTELDDGQIKSPPSLQAENVTKYINFGNSIMSLKIRGSLVYAQSFEKPFNSMIHKLVILKHNASVFIDSTILSSLPSLELVDFANNGLQFLPETLFLHNGMLRTCYFSYNMLQTIPPYLFKQTTKLKYLRLDHNQLNTIPPQLLENNENLEALFLDHNRLRHIPATFFVNNFRIYSIRLNNNRLESLNATLFPKNMRLSELNLDNNQLWDLNLALLNDPEEKSREELEKLGYSPNPYLTPHRSSYGKAEFVKTNMLVTLNVSHNRLIELPVGMFEHSRFLDSFDSSYNPRLRNLTTAYLISSLRRFTLADCNIEYLRAELDNVYFIDPSRINSVDFSRNKIRGIDRTFFWNCYHLKIIHLRDNLISHLEAGIFKDLHNLYYLDLSGNLLSTLPSELFGLQNLLELNVSRNHITTFDDRKHLFPLLQSVSSRLQVLDLSHNCLTSSAMEPSNGSKTGPFSLLHLNVEHNALTRIPKILFSQRGFRFSLGHNAITNIEAINLEISAYLETEPTTTSNRSLGNSGNTVMSICPNPLDLSKLCSQVSNSSCPTVMSEYIHQFFNAIPHIEFRSCNHTLDISEDHVQRALREISFGCPPLEIKCPERYYQSLFCYGKTPCNVDLILKCPIVESCPFTCDCYKGGPVQRTIVNCSHRNLTVLPSVVPPNTQILHFENNKLQNMSNFSLPLWSGLTELYLDHNRINNAQLSHLPTTLRKLSLKHNRIQKLPKYQDEKMLHFELWLGGNPWLCDCSSVQLKTSLRTSSIIHDGKEILCGETSFSLLDADDEYLCMEKSKFVLNIYLVVFLSTLLPLFIGSASVLYYRNKNSIIAFTFVHYPRLFRCFWKVAEIDKGKQYHAFISYSGSDTHVVKDIIEELEEKEPRMSLCIHERDWLPGNDISSNIANSVCLSRKTVLILSKEFLKSMWFSVELHSAYYQSIEDKVDRLILVLKGELPPFSTLDEDLQVLLSTKTYLVWGERWFWEKLRYALSIDKIHKK